MAGAELAGSLISGGLSLAGGFLAGEKNEDIMQMQIDAQREAQQKGIQWRVDDAKRAGVHPLYALGANVPATYPVALQDTVGPALQEAGQNIGNAVTRMLDTQAKEKHQMDMAIGAAQIDESNARKDLYISEAARNRQQPAASMPGLGIQKESTRPGTVTGTLEGMGQDATVPGTGLIDLEPAKITSSKEGHPDVKAGTIPGYEERNFRGLPMLFPDSAGESPEEIMSEMSLPAYIGLLGLNSKTYGNDWLNEFLKLRYTGDKNDVHVPTLREQENMGRMRTPKKEWWEFFRVPEVFGGYRNPRNK